VHFHAYTTEAIAEVSLYGEKEAAPGGESFAQLKLAEPALLLPGDRFILRQFSPVVTIGGGVVLDAAPLRKMPERAAFLKILMEGDRRSILHARIARKQHEGLSRSRLTVETGWRPQNIDRELDELIVRGSIVRVGELLVDGPAIESLGAVVTRSIESFHAKNPLVPGMGKEELREVVGASPGILASVLERLAQEKRISLTGELVHLPGRGVVMQDEEAESKTIIEQAFSSAGLKVPSLREVLAGLKVDKGRAQKIVTLLLRDRVLVKIAEDLVFHQSAVSALRQKISGLKATTPKIDVARFKDLTGVSRKYAIPLLEYLDRERVTKRVGDGRVIL